MKAVALIYIVFCCFYFCHSAGDEDIRCIDTSCKDVVCEDIPSKCKRNITNAGTYMLSPDICNCCDYCLGNLGEGEACSVGDPSNGKHTLICGPGLTCIPDVDGQSDGACQKMTTACTTLQLDFDTRKKTGKLGRMETRINCDEDGLFASYRCIPGQTCYCTRTNGARIFGQAEYSTIANYMPCDCSRKYYDAVDLIGKELGPHEHFRCTANGDYDRLQCINEKCLCVDASDGAPTYPAKNLVNLTDISKATLPCYTLNKKGQYYKQCELEYVEILKEVQDFENQGYTAVIGYDYPNCDLDGTYAPVQQNKTHKYCVNPEGQILTVVSKKDSTAATMDCRCARANLISTSINKAECLKNGNYKPVQCRRGVCRCVDSNGNQICNSENCEQEEIQAQSMKCENVY